MVCVCALAHEGALIFQLITSVSPVVKPSEGIHFQNEEEIEA
jgi:hypothetical protein